MPTCNAKKSSDPPHSNYSKNYEHERGYDGHYRFNQDQFYDGEFFRDSMHGQGTYKWKNLAVYEGGFYSNFKEGYASLSFSDNSYFEGLFIKNQPFGPGILTHANGRQDAGFWVGSKLVRLSRAVDFIIPRLAPTSAAKIKLLQFRRLIPLNEGNCDSAIDILKKAGCLVEPDCTPYSNLIYDPRSFFFEKEIFEKTYFINISKLSKGFMGSSTEWEKSIRFSGENAEEEEEFESQISQIPSHCLCPNDEFVMEYKTTGDTDICDRESYKGEYEMGILAYFTKYGTIEGFENRMNDIKSDSEILNENITEVKAEESTSDKSKVPKIVSWNRSELCSEMIKQIFRYRAFEGKLNFSLKKLMLGVRTAFRRTGEKEKQCLHFLKMCSIGPAHMIKDLLCNYEINEELMDARGNNSLMFAAATDQHEVIDILLDYGVDVNTFNDESLTPLNLCLLRRLAQANGICNWETSFLPKEIDKTMISDSFTKTEGLDYLQSIPSLDRIFGDGMSISNSISSVSYKKLTTFTSSISFKNVKEGFFYKSLGESKSFPSLSEITLIKISEKQGSHRLILPNSECKNQKYQKCTEAATYQGSDVPIRGAGSVESTPQIDIKIIPKSNRRDEFEKSIQQSSTDKYLFEFSFEKKPSGGGNQGKAVSGRSSKGKTSKLQKEETKEETVEVDKILDLELTKKIAEIDKTIEKLLKRGANPNISEVPKPSIHLGVYTKDINTVHTLLLHGASPDCQLYSNEGLLTPLHVIVLQKSAQEYTDICDLLLKFGANPEEETIPEFSLCEEEKEFLIPEQGRTPLQLLCMRPDLEYVNPIDNLIKIGLMLAKVSDKRHFYKGHSCLTLAMYSNNLTLLKALLDSKYFDPNEILQEDRGTALHFLVSTELQKRTLYETSIKVCDLLIAGGANPLKKFKSPKKLIGTCIDYGYREIEAEKEKRKLSISGKKSEKTGKEKSATRDYLKDHERVVEYLGTIALGMTKKRSSKHGAALGKKEHQNSFKSGLTTIQKTSEKNEEKSAKSSKIKVEGKERDKKERTEREISDDLKKSTNKEGNLDLEEDKNRKKFEKEEKEDTKNKRKEKDEDAGSKKDLKETKGYKKNAGKKGEKEEQPREKNKVKDDEKVTSKNLEKGSRKTESNLLKPMKSSPKSLLLKKLGTRSETFPEKLRKTLLRIYGTCANIDINEFLVPYVVLRNGELYYRFQGKLNQKEQYSLI